jgi:sugar phosphate permease
MLGNRNVLALCVMYVPNSVVFYFCITWLPTYLKEQQGFTPAAANLLAGLPLVMSVTGDLFGGLVTDWVTARFGLRHGRSTLGVVSYLIAAACLLAVPYCRQPVLAAVFIALAVTATMFSLAGAWATCMDVGREHTGTVGAAMNTAGQIGALLCPIVVAYAVEWFGNWNIPIFIMSALFVTGAVAWKVIDPREPVFVSLSPGPTS